MSYPVYVAADRVDGLLALVRQRGRRVTTCRRALLAELVRTSEHVTADDLAERVRERHPDIHRSTIYRSLSDLEDLGIVDHVHLGHGRAVYHLADDAHQHVVCEACGYVMEVPDEIFEPLERALRDDFGFELLPGHFAVVGRCAACARSVADSDASGGG